MAQRSPYNDRYKVDQKGKTRKSASAAKPKRAVADLTPAEAAKKPAAKRSWFSPRTPPANAIAIPTTPEMKRLRRIWWVLWGTALGVAVLILVLQQTKTLLAAIPFVWGIWAAAMGGAFYLEFVPLRKMRTAAIEAARAGNAKPGKPPKGPDA
jgi:hypothetical protein